MLKLLFQQLDCIPFLFFFTESTESFSTGQCSDPERLREAPAPGPTEATADHRRQLGQEGGRSRAATRGSPKSPTPPSSPHLAVPPPALLHAPTPLPRYLERCHPAAAGWVGEGEQTLDQETLSRGSWGHHSLHRRGTAGSQHGPDAAVQNH